MMTAFYIVLGVVLMWLFVLSYYVFKTRQHYERLTKKTRAGTLETALEHLLNGDKKHASDIVDLKKSIAHLDEGTKHYYQKMGFVKFNPFDRIGGEQSFVISLLDKEDNGIVLNFLYTREGVRIYAKPVKEGTGTEYELAKEEMEAIKKAR